MPALQIAARDQARRVLTLLLAPYLGRSSATCNEFSYLVTLTIYSQALLPSGDVRTPLMVALTNVAYQACGSFPAAIGYDYHRTLAKEKVLCRCLCQIVEAQSQLMTSMSFRSNF